jgi:hypothetical protein
MLKKKLLIFSLLLPLYSYPQDMETEVTPDVQIGSSGIDLAPEEEISTPTEAPAIETEATAPEPAPSAPETPTETPTEAAPVESTPTQ